MKTIKIKRLWHGLASVRDYEIEKAIKKNESIKLVVGKECMTLTPEMLKERGFQTVGSPFKSIIVSGMTYKLIDFAWKPDSK